MRLVSIIKYIIVLIAALWCPYSLFGATWTDNGSYNITWYDKNKSEFEISTPEQLAGVAYLVNNNFANFYRKKINITADINLEGKSWTPIGMGTMIFQGSIDGNNHLISGISISAATSSSPYCSGMWIKLKNSTIKNINFRGFLYSDVNCIGFIAANADACTFENIAIDSNITFNHPSIHANTNFTYNSLIGGMIGQTSSCQFKDIIVNSYISYTFGSSNGNNCYGNIGLGCGGIVASGSSDKFLRCHSINNHRYHINGFVTTSNYTNNEQSFLTFGGIIGSLKNTSEIIGCLAENKYFLGAHDCGTFDTMNFRFGGIVGYMSKYDSTVLKNCVAINDSYCIQGHDYSWQAAWYHTNSNFGGVAYEIAKYYAGCYSNNDVSKNISKVKLNNSCSDGSSSFSKAQMNTQSFVDELNFYSQLEYDGNFWELKSGKLSIKSPNSQSYVTEIISDDVSTINSIYSINGIYMGTSVNNLPSGIYIIRLHNSVKKIVIH